MDRRSFIKIAAASALAVGAKGANAAIFDGENYRNAMQQDDAGLSVRFLGTGAADWFDKDERGEYRRLSSVLLEGHIIIDFTPLAKDMIPPMAHPDTIFYTHSHGDHYNPKAAIELGIKRVYLSNTWYDCAVADFTREAKKLKVSAPEIIPLYVGQSVEVDGVRFTPAPANHATAKRYEQPLIYVVEKGHVRLLYATDTATLPAYTTRWLNIDRHVAEAKPLTAIIMEATMGMGHNEDYRLFTHSSVFDVERMVKVLTSTKRYTPPVGQPVYLTHMARTMHGTQAELDAQLPAPLKAAYDGLEVVFR
ncbi:MAG: MBL fold metallo-hydrolase [Alistipes sp.]|nr:MBL fold metallo-hydrolase [Alistipes sp.]